MKLNSKFKLFMQTDLSSSDFKVLTLLYQPLIGMEANSLYSTFYQLAKRTDEMTHRMLLDILNIKQKDFIQYREKLEAFSLLETYQKNDLEYLYILKPPFSAKQFLVDTFLGTYLESEIGEKNLKNLIEIFKIEKPKTQYLENITKSFDDLYEFDSHKLLNIGYDLEGRNGNTLKLIRNGIDYEKFVESLPRGFVSPILYNENFKEKIIQLAYVYQFNINDLVQIYSNAHNGRKNITIEQINLQAKIYYEKQNQVVMVKDKEVSDDELLSSLPFKTIVEKFGSSDPFHQSMALATINDFISQNEIDLGVLNVLIIFILKNKNGILPHVNYLNKVWESWAKNGVQTPSDAIKYRDEIERKYTNNKTKTAKKVVKPDWIEEYLQEISEMEAENK